MTKVETRIAEKVVNDPQFSSGKFLVSWTQDLGCLGIHLWLINWDPSNKKHGHLGGGFKHFLFSPLLGEMIQFD